MTEPRTRRVNSLTRFTRAEIDGRLVDLHTALPGVVVSYDPGAQEADVRVPLRREVQDTEGSRSPLDIPVISRVPVLFPRGGGFSITHPIAAGDEVLLVFAERDASEWLKDGRDHVPGSARMHDYSDAVAIPGYASEPNRLSAVNADGLEIRSDDGQTTVTLGSDGSVRIVGPGGLSFGDGVEEMVSLISESLDVMHDLLIDHDNGGDQPVSSASKATIVALKARADAMKAP